MRTITLIILLAAFCFFPHIIQAAEISFSNLPSSIQKDQEVVVDVVVSGAAANTINYIRGAFFHVDSPTSYFGYVFNHNNIWYNGTPSPIDPKQYLQVEINNEGSWSGQLKIKIDAESAYIKGNGNYSFKVGRYTASATSVSNWSSSSSIGIHGIQPTPTSTPKPTPTEKPKPTWRPAKIPTQQELPNSSVSNTEEVLSESDNPDDYEDDFGGDSTFANLETQGVSVIPTRRVEKQETQVKGARNTIFPLFLVCGAVILIIGCGILLVRAYRRQEMEGL